MAPSCYLPLIPINETLVIPVHWFQNCLPICLWRKAGEGFCSSRLLFQPVVSLAWR